METGSLVESPVFLCRIYKNKMPSDDGTLEEII